MSITEATRIEIRAGDSFDYCFVSDVGEIKTAADFEAAGEGAVKILVARDGKSKSVFAHVVPMKGVDEAGFAVECLWMMSSGSVTPRLR